MKRAIVNGSSGAGKSTFARKPEEYEKTIHLLSEYRSVFRRMIDE